MLARLALYLRRHHLALLALFVALGGTSYAAFQLPANSVTTKQVKNFSLLTRDFKRGQIPAGKRGAAGQRGLTGQRGPTGLAGTRGATGPAGPFPDPLTSGKTVRGTFDVADTAVLAGEIAETGISFGFTLASQPTVHFIPSGGTPPAACPGTPEAPAAQPGHFCMYEKIQSNRTEHIFDPITNTEIGGLAAPYGAWFRIDAVAPGAYYSRGMWAVTAP